MVAFIINPRGDFPLADDWAFAATVKSLLGGGGLKLTASIIPNIIAQVLWGALFCLPFGFSFTALRISTLTLGVIGVLSLYGLLREADADREAALFGALLLAFNPFYLSLSYTFMSDVPFTAVSLVSLYFLIRGMRRNSKFEVAAGLLLACVALLIRQTGLAIFMAFGLAYLVKTGLRLRTVFLASIPVALGGFVQVLWDQWMEYRHISPRSHSLQSALVLSPRSYISWHAAEPFATGLIVLSAYLGLFLFPLLLFVGRRRWEELCRSRLPILATLLFAVFACYKLSSRRMPMLQNVFYDFGLGPATLPGAPVLRLPSLPAAGKLFWFVVTYLGIAGAVALVHATLIAIGKTLNLLHPLTGKRQLLVITLASGLIYVVPVSILCLMGKAFDRYVLLLVPLGIAVIFVLVSDAGWGKVDSRTMPLAVASLVLYGVFSIAGTHDYLSWNRTRWQALNNLMTEQRLSVQDIDGGYEFNGWYLHEQKDRENAGPEAYWWTTGADFRVSLGPVPGYSELRRYQFRRWLPPAEGNILVLRRTTRGILR
jgi:hypothetical protein